MDALLIIDMQKGSFLHNPRYDAKNVIGRINKLSAFFRSNGRPVIFIQHDGSRQGSLVHGSMDWEILDELAREESDRVFEKTANDSFYGTALHDHLKRLDIDRLYITGCATDFCVNATIHGALTRDYDVVVVQDAHTTADRPCLKAKKVIEFHNWLWGSLTPTRGRITVEATEDIVHGCIR